ncbi:TetR/AcrR family transcriptional regulator [Blastococcus brunescens]|uniref:TetR family transcriptional regulator C-terminal domain-containing protein n=1 Tax=Blastococcus brunescens TaxID=1564165 RepID=A0ABZ1AYP5_9ACTN|nr:TetR family transcriptional regulator C-terminal domain-containing protein [Blastococcus sp. BMG 8361]WRL63687.1 TetR family transcriptional regulator C-terminal domain-containing protein [Blastococcus sp. BMG 8361]
MPRIVDAEQRRRELAAAVWRVIRRDGVTGASVRAVAREADTSMGALRHWFATQDALLRFAMLLVTERARARIEAVVGDGPLLPSHVLAVLEETLPLDDERRAEAEVWLALVARALVDPDLAALRDRAAADLHGLCSAVVVALTEAAEEPLGVDVPLEAERLYAVLDGLALHALTRPAALPADRARAVLEAHLAGLRGTPSIVPPSERGNGR